MDIIVRQSYKNVKPFALKDLPDLVVLTGKNGTGKTQLLDYLYKLSRYNKDGQFVAQSEDEKPDENIPEWSIEESEIGVSVRIAPAEISIKGDRQTNMVFRGVQAPTVEVGGKYDPTRLYNEGENIAQKHLFYRTHMELLGEGGMDVNNLSNAFNNALGIRRGNRPGDTVLPSLSQQDFDIIKRIEEEHPDSDYSKDPFYYIAYQQPPKTSVFAANLKFLYIQYWARIKAGMDVGAAPWNAFNEMGKMLSFKFELDEPNIMDKRFDVRLRDKERKVFISPDSLSSGEKVIFSLFVAMYTTHTSEHLPSIMLFDEPDAYLHPSLCHTMLDVMQKVFVDQHKIKIIMTTHSPTTVAMAPETSIFRMDAGEMVKSSKRDAILSLTAGLSTISVYYENIKQVFVEADNDNLFLTHIFHHAISGGYLNPDISLRFVNVGDDKEGGCTIVRKVVNDLTKADNKTIFGIIDWDHKNGDSDRIKILGGSKRYAIDNYILDPLTLVLLYLEESHERTKIGFEASDSIVRFSKKTHDEKQSYINNVVKTIEAKIPEHSKEKNDLIEYTILCGEKFSIPQWFMENCGHDLNEWIRAAIPFLGKYKTDKTLYKKIVETCYGNYPEIIPMDIVDTLKIIQEL